MKKNNNGFTMIELMIVLAITSGVFAMTYWSIATQHRAYGMQEEVAQLQQNLRTALYIMSNDIRIAGYDPLKSAGASIIGADTNPSNGSGATIQFSADFTGGQFDFIDNDMDGSIDETDESRYYDGAIGANETISYSLFDYPSTSPDGDLDLGRNTGGGNEPLAENIDALDFAYLDGNNPPNVLNPGGGSVPAADLPNIRAVQITIIGRVDRADPNYLNNTVYNNPQGVQILAAQNDNFHRQMMTRIVNFRNIGL